MAVKSAAGCCVLHSAAAGAAAAVAVAAAGGSVPRAAADRKKHSERDTLTTLDSHSAITITATERLVRHICRSHHIQT